mmetsp:Transcript_15881/g.22086  ORF Transcript_15881/g.22086 Transcript_15881/m.22086 type:complete len:260 (+) Transcript_15881:94-873(+)
MQRNQYDTDIATWSPHGRLYQVEYAQEAVKQGSACVGIRGKDCAVVCSLKRAPKEKFASHQKKVFEIALHCGMAISGLISDARVMAEWMRTECMNYEYAHDSPCPLSLLAELVANEMHNRTLNSSQRPLGVGSLLIGSDSTGCHLYQIGPSGLIFPTQGAAIGARSQSARMYLEKRYQQFATSDLNEITKHALKALSMTCGDDVKLDGKNTDVSVIGIGKEFGCYADNDVDALLDEVQRSKLARESNTTLSNESMFVAS